MKRGQSKYMPHLRTKSTSYIQAIGRANRGAGAAKVISATGESTNEYGIRRTDAEMKTKGQYGGLCNRSACLSREAYWWNRGSYAHYCETCARLINDDFRFRDDVELYGSLLVQPPSDVTVVDLSTSDQLDANEPHEKPWAIQHSNGKLAYADTEEEARKMQRHFRYVVGLRGDGSNPLWFSDMEKRYADLRTQVTIKDSR